jgi:hypothetical protein
MDWQLCSNIQKMVTFETADFREPRPVREPFDLVFCRNVMIYFDAKTKRKIFDELHRVLIRAAGCSWAQWRQPSVTRSGSREEIIENTTVYISR